MIVTITLNTAIDRILHIKDTLDRKKNNKVTQATIDVGGKATHVSMVLSALGLNNTATGFIGERNKDTLLSLLNKAHVNCAFVEQKDASVRETLVLVDSSGSGSYMITEPGFTVTEQSQQTLLTYLSNTLTTNDLVVIAGSPPQDFPVSYYRTILDTCNSNGAKVIVDASGVYLAEAITVRPYLIKPNEYEFQSLVGKPLTTTQAFVTEIKNYMKQGIEYVIVSLGKEGSLVGYKDQVYQVTPPIVEEKNDTGCGDVFVGGMVASIYNKYPLPEALSFATALSASKATHETSSGFSLTQTKALQKQVKIALWEE